MPTSFRFAVADRGEVSALIEAPRGAIAALVLAHGAGAGMHHRFMEEAAAGLAARRIATLRYQFPFMEAGGKRPDAAPIAQATVRAAVAQARRRLSGMPLFAGGKSFGGRMASQAQAMEPLAGVAGLVFLGFPLHPAGSPSEERARHLQEVRVPMLFIQGTRDALAEHERISRIVSRLHGARLETLEGADHAFHVPVRSGRTDAQALAQALDATASWIASQAPPAV